MTRRIRHLDPNLRLKMISVILAMAIWYMINNFSDPSIRMTVNNVPVELLHGEVVENHGDVYTILDNTNVIPVVIVQAKRSVIDKLEARNIIATADVRDMEENGAVRIVLTTDKYSNSIDRITGSISHVYLRVEPQKTRSLAVNVETEGDPADGFILYETSAEQNQVDLTGPQSYVEEIGRAAARVDITGSERSINSYPNIILYNEAGEEVSAEEMTAHKLHLNISSVKVSTTIYQTREIPVTCSQELPLEEGYELEGVPEVEPETIRAAGAAGILRETDSITIPAEDISSEPVSSNIHKRIDIRDYLPDGILLIDDSDKNATVYVRVKESVPEEVEGGSTENTSSPGDAAQESAEKQ